MSAAELLDREFLEIRARIIQLAASLDRLDRASGDVSSDPRKEQLKQAIGVLPRNEGDRVEDIQLVFSLPYDEGWRDAMELPPSQ
jgi:hypothetical protein